MLPALLGDRLGPPRSLADGAFVRTVESFDTGRGFHSQVTTRDGLVTGLGAALDGC